MIILNLQMRTKAEEKGFRIAGLGRMFPAQRTTISELELAMGNPSD